MKETDFLQQQYKKKRLYGGSEFTSEFQTVYDSWTTKPSASVAGEMNTMVQGWIASGYWATRDVKYVHAVHTNDNGEALTNWKNPGTNDATMVNAPTFVAFEGFTGDGSTSHIITYNPVTEGVNFTQNSASMVVYSRTDAANGGIAIGLENGSTANTSKISLRVAGNLLWTRVNDSASNSVSGITDSLGMYVSTRTSSSNIDVYKNKNKTIITEASTGITNDDFYVLALNHGGSAWSYSTRQISMASFGGAVAQSHVDSCTDDFETYMDSNGKGVIS